ncbi:unnamed protein product [Rangifer tarandus platyrhynchus]|uniref:Uncharacterized protein n=1 Tax=Rangifer tarandus platyrhynchus TaxID=3082113 RepID=A0AC59ZR87_RANTA
MVRLINCAFTGTQGSLQPARPPGPASCDGCWAACGSPRISFKYGFLRGNALALMVTSAAAGAEGRRAERRGRRNHSPRRRSGACLSWHVCPDPRKDGPKSRTLM